MAPGVHSLTRAVCVWIVAAGCDGFGGGSGDLLDRKPAGWSDYEPEFQSRRAIQSLYRGDRRLVIFATGLGAVTQSGQLFADQRPGDRVVEWHRASGIFCRPGAGLYRPISGECDDPGRHASGVRDSPYPQSGGATEQFGVGIVTVVQEKMGRFGVKLLTARPRNVIKSGEHRFASEFRWLPRRFVLKGKDFS